MGKKRASPGADTEKNPSGDAELSDVHSEKLHQICEEANHVDIFIDFLTHETLAPFLRKRREVLKSIPNFWPVALMNNPNISIHAAHHQDQVALSYLEDIWVERNPKERRCFTLEFHFKENPFFSDSVLKKEYRYLKPAGADDKKKDEWGVTEAQAAFSWDTNTDPQAIKIKWKDNAHNLTKTNPLVLDQDGELSEPGSFFNLFEVAKDHMDLGVLIANEIYPEAMEYFKGTAVQNYSDDEEDEEDEEDDDDEEEIDLEKPRTKKQRT